MRGQVEGGAVQPYGFGCGIQNHGNEEGEYESQGNAGEYIGECDLKGLADLVVLQKQPLIIPQAQPSWRFHQIVIGERIIQGRQDWI